MSKATHIVRHANLYLMSGGKMTHFPAGTPLTLTEKQAKGYGSRVTPIQTEVVDLSGADDGTEAAAKEAAKKVTADLRARAVELGIEGAEKWGDERLIETIEQVEKANAV